MGLIREDLFDYEKVLADTLELQRTTEEPFDHMLGEADQMH